MSETFAKGLYARVNRDGKFKWIRVRIHRKNPVPVENTTAYFLRYMDSGKRKVKPLGKDLNRAFIAWQNHVSDVERIASGRAPIYTEESDAPVSTRQTIHDAAEAYLASNADKVLKNKRSARSVDAYDKAVIDFRDSVSVRFMDEITAMVLLDHETWLYKNLERRGIGKQQNTIVNRFRYLNIFLRSYGIQMVKAKNAAADDKGLMRYDDAPQRSSDKVVDVYSPEEIKLLMDAATVDEADVIQFFLKLGVRDGEAAHAEWSDIESKAGGHEFHVQEKPEFDWKPKNKKDRKIDLSEGLYKRLLARKQRDTPEGARGPKHSLIFPNGRGEPDRIT